MVVTWGGMASDAHNLAGYVMVRRLNKGDFPDSGFLCFKVLEIWCFKNGCFGLVKWWRFWHFFWFCGPSSILTVCEMGVSICDLAFSYILYDPMSLFLYFTSPECPMLVAIGANIHHTDPTHRASIWTHHPEICFYKMRASLPFDRCYVST